MKLAGKTLVWVVVIVLVLAASTAAKPGFGTISGIVLDPSGTPQMGATVWLLSEDAGGQPVSQLLSNQHGAFITDRLKPGKYSLRVSLPGFLPAMEQHVSVLANLTTLLRVQVDSLFSSLDTLRRQSDAPAEPDDWKWVLRSSAATRTILQWREGDIEAANTIPVADFPRAQRARGLVQVTNGALQQGSSSNLSDSPATAVSYDQGLGAIGRLLLAGQMSYERGASGAFATVWLPSGILGQGPETTFVMRQSTVGIRDLAFQEMRFDHSERISLGDRLALRAGAELLHVGITTHASALRPHAQLDANLAPGWTASFLVASSTADDVRAAHSDALQSALTELDSLPTVLFRDGRPVFEGRWHEEASIKHKLGERASIETAAFHDAARHQAIFGSGPASSPDFLQDTFSNTFLYDGGALNSWGARAAYSQKLSSNLELAALYSWAGALTPQGNLNTTAADLRDSFATRKHHSVGTRVSGKLPRTGTQFAASYMWVSGATLSRLDAFGEAAYQLDPNLHVSLRQPLPSFGPAGHWEVLADFGNLLAQGYMPVNGQDSRIMLVPVLRSFRGGVSFQF
jgi:Carboxypeptidase regulatory-like domain